MKGFINNFRYPGLVCAVSLGLMLIFGMSCGEEGGGSKNPSVTNQDSGGWDISPNADVESELASLELYGSINQTTDYSGYLKLLGEVKNTGGGSASFVNITFTFYDDNSNIIDTAFTYIHGSCMTLSLSNIETNTVLLPDEVGAFELYTFVDADLISTNTHNILFDVYDVEYPDAKLVIEGNISAQEDYSGDLELLGNVKNIGTTGLIFGEIIFIIKNNEGLVIDTCSSYINGENIYISSIGSYTDTGLNIDGTGTFSVSTMASFNKYSSYYYKTDWTDVEINNNVAAGLAFNNTHIRMSADDKRKSRERDIRIESLISNLHGEKY